MSTDPPRNADPRPGAWSNLLRDGEFVERRTELLDGLVELIESCSCAPPGPCDFPRCPRRPLPTNPPSGRPRGGFFNGDPDD